MPVGLDWLCGESLIHWQVLKHRLLRSLSSVCFIWMFGTKAIPPSAVVQAAHIGALEKVLFKCSITIRISLPPLADHLPCQVTQKTTIRPPISQQGIKQTAVLGSATRKHRRRLVENFKAQPATMPTSVVPRLPPKVKHQPLRKVIVPELLFGVFTNTYRAIKKPVGPWYIANLFFFGFMRLPGPRCSMGGFSNSFTNQTLRTC